VEGLQLPKCPALQHAARSSTASEAASKSRRQLHAGPSGPAILSRRPRASRKAAIGAKLPCFGSVFAKTGNHFFARSKARSRFAESNALGYFIVLPDILIRKVHQLCENAL
jgi:hypothetical protein